MHWQKLLTLLIVAIMATGVSMGVACGDDDDDDVDDVIDDDDEDDDDDDDDDDGDDDDDDDDDDDSSSDLESACVNAILTCEDDEETTSEEAQERCEWTSSFEPYFESDCEEDIKEFSSCLNECEWDEIDDCGEVFDDCEL